MIYRHLAFLGDESQWAAEASECAAEQGRFWPYHDRLYEVQAGRNSGAFSKERLKTYGADAGLEIEAFGTCLDTGRYQSRVVAETAAGRAKGVNSTPTLLINGQRLPGAPTFEEVFRAVTLAALSRRP